MTLQTAKPHHRHIAMLAAPHLRNPLTLLRLAVPAAPPAPVTVMQALRLHVCHHSRLHVSRSVPTCAPHMVYLLKQPRCDLVCVDPSQPRPHSYMSLPPKWAGVFPQPRAMVLPMVKFGQSKPDGLGRIDTADSDLMHHQYRLSLSFSGIQARRAGTPPILLRRPVEGSMRLFFKKPVIMFRTSPISSLRILATQTLLSCSTRTPLSLTLWCLPSEKTPQAKVLGAYGASHRSRPAAPPLTFRDINGHILLSTLS